MIPRQSALGRSFKGAGAYYLHDKEALTSTRVAFTHCENIPTQDPRKALKWMAWTAMHAEELKARSGAAPTGVPCEKPVFTLTLSFHPEQEPTKWEMVGIGRRALIALGLEDHETLMVAHNDTLHPHLHLIVNTVHPQTGRVNRLSSSKLKLSKWAGDYERQEGKIYCKQREENNARRDQGQKVNVHADVVSELYNAAYNGKAFQAALAERGFKLARGRNGRILLIDAEGVTFNLARRVEGVKSKEIKTKLSDIHDQLQPLSAFEDQLETRRKEKFQNGADDPNEKAEQLYFDRERQDRDWQDRDWQESIIDAAINAPVLKDARTKDSRNPPAPGALNSLQDRQLGELGRFYDAKAEAQFRLNDLLERQYGGDERKLRSQAEGLERTLASSGRLRTWWLKFTGRVPKTAEKDLQDIRRTLENIEWRRNEAQQALSADVRQRQEEIAARQRDERASLGLDWRKPEPAHEPNQEFADTLDYEDDHGPSMNF